MKMLTGYLSASEGRARIAGHDMATERMAGARKLGYLPEKGPLYPDMTPFSLLDFFAEARGMKKAKKLDQIEKVVELCALGSVIYKPINKLSKGYRQRVGMAQALIHEPEVLILDEPTSGLDPNQIRGVRQTMKRLGEKKNDSVVDTYSSRSQSDGQSRCDDQRRPHSLRWSSRRHRPQ